jgi:predicted DNA-binding transcriptional regulator AlpA
MNVQEEKKVSGLKPVINAKKVADLLGYTDVGSFYHKRPMLEARHGFPRKLPGMNGWSSKAILAWIEDPYGETKLSIETAAPPRANRLEEAYAS